MHHWLLLPLNHPLPSPPQCLQRSLFLQPPQQYHQGCAISVPYHQPFRQSELYIFPRAGSRFRKYLLPLHRLHAHLHSTTTIHQTFPPGLPLQIRLILHLPISLTGPLLQPLLSIVRYEVFLRRAVLSDTKREFPVRTYQGLL